MNATGIWKMALGGALAFALLAPAAAQPSAAPGAGFADPQGLPKRAAPADIEPVYRGPSIDTLATVRKRGVLRVGVVATAPMVMRDGKGALVGYSIDLGRRLAQDLGVQIEFVETSWTQVIPDLIGRQFDLIASGLWVTAPRALVVNFSTPSATEGVYLVAGRRGVPAARSLAEFDKPGMKIAVYADTAQARVAARVFPRAALLKLEGNADPLAAVLAGQAQAALIPTIAPRLLLRSAPEQLYLPSSEPVSLSRTAFALRKGDADFLSYLNTWLALQQDEGWLDERAVFWSASTDWLQP